MFVLVIYIHTHLSYKLSWSPLHYEVSLDESRGLQSFVAAHQTTVEYKILGKGWYIHQVSTGK